MPPLRPDAVAAVPRVAAIVVAAGRGRRFGGGDNKVLYPLAGVPVWQHAVAALRQCQYVDETVVVVRPDDRPVMASAAAEMNVELVDGGTERFDSVRIGLAAIGRLDRESGFPADRRWVAIHDAARPLVPAADINAVVSQAFDCNAAILAMPIRGTVKRRTSDGEITTVDRTELWEALTPQVFRFDILDAAYRRWRGRPVTDDAEMVERSGIAVALVAGSAENLKITQAEDLAVAEAIFCRRQAAGNGSL